MISDDEKWEYLTITTLSALLKEIMSKDKGDLYCLDCVHSSRNKFDSHVKSLYERQSLSNGITC